MRTSVKNRVPPNLLRNRPNKTAKGMSATVEICRQSSRLSNDAITLAVCGTLDELRPKIIGYTRRDKCPCCGASSRGLVRLNDRGRELLQRYKKHGRAFRV